MTIVGYVNPDGSGQGNWSRPVETRIRPAPAWNSAGELARRHDPAAYAQGVQAGHDDAIAHLEPLIRALWSDLRAFRGRRSISHREHADYRIYSRLADANTVVLRDLFAIRRALKGGVR